MNQHRANYKRKKKEEESGTSKSFMAKIKSVLDPSKSKEKQLSGMTDQSNVNRRLEFDVVESTAKLNETFPQSNIEKKTDGDSRMNVTFPMTNKEKVDFNHEQELTILLNKDLAKERLKRSQLNGKKIRIKTQMEQQQKALVNVNTKIVIAQEKTQINNTKLFVLKAEIDEVLKKIKKHEEKK